MSFVYTIPGIYNALDIFPTYSLGMSKSNSKSQNQKALQACVDYAISLLGGIVLIPSVDAANAGGAYAIGSAGSGAPAVSSPSSGSGARLLVCGTGLGTQIVMQDSGDVFYVNNDNWVSFQDLDVSYYQSGGTLTGTAFHFYASEGCELFRCKTNNCEQAVEFSNANDIAYMSHCTITYDSNYPATDLTAILVMNGSETYITSCVLRFTVPGNVATTQIGISIKESSYTHLTDVQIENFYYGVQIGNTGASANGVMFTNVRIANVDSDQSTCLYITQNTYDARFIGCHFQSVGGQMHTTHNIVLDPAGGLSSSIDTIFFDTCTSRFSSDYGIEIKGGENIQIVGGEYSGNGSSAGAGIAIDGDAHNVQIIGANCVGEAQGSTPQQNGISITAGHRIQIVGVSCLGNDGTTGAGIAIGGTASDVTISGAVCNGPFLNGTPQAYGIAITGTPGTIAIRGSKLTNNGSTGHGGYGLNVNLSSGAASSIYVSDCDLSGNNSGPLNVSGTAPWS